MEKKMFIYAKNNCNKIILLLFYILIISFGCKENNYSEKVFIEKSKKAIAQLKKLEERFKLCESIAQVDYKFMQSIVFPEVMRFNELQNEIEVESLKALYVQFGKEYANFSIGLFQMKPSFAEEIETLAIQNFSDSIYKELQLGYLTNSDEEQRQVRLDRLQDSDWQLIYLTAFIEICNKKYANENFKNLEEKMQWYAAVYNLGLNENKQLIKQKIKTDLNSKKGMRYVWKSTIYYKEITL